MPHDDRSRGISIPSKKPPRIQGRKAKPKSSEHQEGKRQMSNEHNPVLERPILRVA